jgi:hypothetical protein
VSETTPSYPGRSSESEPYVILDDEVNSQLCKDEHNSGIDTARTAVPTITGLGGESKPCSLTEDRGEDIEDFEMLTSNSE